VRAALACRTAADLRSTLPVCEAKGPLLRAQCPMPNAQCPMLNDAYSMLNAFAALLPQLGEGRCEHSNRPKCTENLVRKVTRDRPACVQKLRHTNDVAGEQQQSFVDIEGFSGWREFRLLHTKANEEPLRSTLSVGH